MKGEQLASSRKICGTQVNMFKP